LAKSEYLNLANGHTEEDVLLRAAIEAALTQPSSKPATLLHTINAQIEPRLMRDIERELQLLDDSLDIKLEFEGARTQLTDMAQQQRDVGVLDLLKEKPFSTLTIEEREMLVNMTIRKNDGK
jgi:DNA primase